MKRTTPRTQASPASEATLVRVIAATGQYTDASVIHIWKRGELAEELDEPFKMRNAAIVMFDASPAIARVAYLWTGRLALFVASDNHGRWFDVSAQPVAVQFLSGDRALFEGDPTHAIQQSSKKGSA